MSKEDTNSIKYILDEMDPAEKVEFERDMTKNPDLRIEVESIRRMKKKLNSLPDLSPPRHLTDSILSYAAGQSNKKSGTKSGYFLSAAFVIIGLTTGSLVLNNPFVDSLPNASSAIPSYGQELTQQSESRPADLQPWIDRQDVLHLSGFETVTNPTFTSETENRFNKLRPVGRYPDFTPFSRSVQLTGSNR